MKEGRSILLFLLFLLDEMAKHKPRRTKRQRPCCGVSSTTGYSPSRNLKEPSSPTPYILPTHNRTMDFDETRLYYSHQQLQETVTAAEDADGEIHAAEPVEGNSDEINLPACRRHFREFLRNYRLGAHRYLYRDRLLRLHRRRNDAVVPALGVDLAHLGEYDSALLGYLLEQPATLLPTLELAAADALSSLLYETSSNAQDPDQDDTLGDDENAIAEDNTNATKHGMTIQILLTGQLQATPLRQIHAAHMNRLLQCPGLVISTSPVKSRAVQLSLCCHRCLDTQTIIHTAGPWQSIPLPSTCAGPNSEECGRFPYTVDPDQSRFVDQQTIKLQEAPETVPVGELPRSVVTVVDRALVDRAPPGTRVSLLCIPTLMPGGGGRNGGRDSTAQAVYLRVVGLIQENDAHGPAVRYTPAEEEAFTRLAARPDVYEILLRSTAPNISGSYTVDIKKAMLCQLMGGSSKRLPDGMRLRGTYTCVG